MSARDLAASPEPYVRADLYDLLFAGLTHDLPFWVEIAREARGPVLDLACGTGRVLVALLAAGVDAEGADLYPEMLARARARAEAAGFDPPLHAADMRALALPRRYAAVVMPFNAFAHNLTLGEQLATLRGCHDHLLPGGTLAFDAFTPDARMLAQPAAAPELEVEAAHPEDGHPVQLWDARDLDPATRLQRSRIEVRELNHDRTPRATHRFETRVRWVEPGELGPLLARAGFPRHQVWSGYQNQPLAADSTWLVIQAWRD